MPLDKSEIKILANSEEITQTAALEFTRHTIEEVRFKGFLAVALSGGSTPKGLYSLIASEGSTGFRLRVPWNKIHFFWGDERHVPPDHPESNYRNVYEAMLSKVPVPPENVHRFKAENPDAGKAAEDYERVLREFFRLKAEQLQRFDMVFLGMGADGHTASLFPRTEVIHEEQRLLAAPWIEGLNTYRITLTPPMFNNADRVIFLVGGENKAEALRAVLRGDYQPERFPAQIIRPTNGKLLWLVDQAAARLLELNEENNIKPE